MAPIGNPLTRVERFAWGCFGSLLPEIIRIYAFVTHQNSLPVLQWRYIAVYVIISVVFMMSAGGFTIAWEAENAFKAIWVGASFPALVSALIRSAPALPS